MTKGKEKEEKRRKENNKIINLKKMLIMKNEGKAKVTRRKERKEN